MELSRNALACLLNEDGLIFYPWECETLAVNCVRVQKGHRTPPATHADEEEVYVVIAGSGAVFLDGKMHEVGAGDVLYIPRNTEHIIEGESEEPLTYVCVANWPDKPGRA